MSKKNAQAQLKIEIARRAQLEGLPEAAKSLAAIDARIDALLNLICR